MAKFAKLAPDLLSVLEIIDFDVLPPIKAGRVRPLVIDPVPAFDAATQKITFGAYVLEANQVRQTWQTVALSQTELDSLADKAERQTIKGMIATITTDIKDSSIDQAQAQAYIDITAPTNEQRNDEVVNSAKRHKSAEQRYRRLARIVKQLAKIMPA